MCGLTGFWRPAGFDAEGSRGLALGMARRIASRGPDAEGAWIDGGAGIALAHRRLAVVDLSDAGAQPMHSAGGRYVIVFNGEIYNHAELRTRLGPAASWRGHSDTEALLAGFEAWGLRATLEAAVGMFAFALWDRHEHVLWLGRDRLGEKPLFWGWQGRGEQRTLLFGSELKALRAHPAFAAAICRDALVAYMRLGYVPAPHSIFEGIHKLEPGTMLRLDGRGGDGETVRYWSAVEMMLDGTRSPSALAPEETVEQLDALLRSAVRQQMVADVPLGAFLSGGVDSSTIVALMQAQSTVPIRTYSIGFHEEGYDEAAHAARVARHLGTDHTELYVTSQQALQVVPDLPGMYDEPFADSSQIPTHLVARLARSQVTVALSGDGGDELFCGYNRYEATARLWRRVAAVPLPARRAVASLLQRVSEPAWDRLVERLAPVLPPLRHWSRAGSKLHKGARALGAAHADELYLGAVSQWQDPASVVLGGIEAPGVLGGAMPRLAGLADVPRMMAYDLLSYLPDDILVKVDRAAMAVSLETRVPMLDHRVVEFAWRLPMDVKLRDGQTKWALRQVLYRYVPQAMIERPKMGFGVPIDHWLRGPLRDWAESLLSTQSLAAGGLLDPAPIRRIWQQHLSGTGSMHHPLWNVLMFQAWREHDSRSSDEPAPMRQPPLPVEP